jgi:predicted GNAT superfamily acetyltransferase
MNVTIRPAQTLADCRRIEQLQLEIWGSGDLEVAPDHLIFTIAKEGGVVLLALDEQETPIGFGYAFIGLTPDHRFKLASHQVGVLPAYQDQGVGYHIKLAQREAALARQLDLITWTFDPLQGRNARFNLRKLGAVCNTYLRELYGEMRNDLNQGLPSDRFKVDWWISAGHVVDRIKGQAAEPALSTGPVLNPTKILSNDLPAPPDTFDLPTTAFCRVEIPADIQRLKSEAPELAFQWHRQTREIFETAFAQGYTAVDLLRHQGRNYYLLQKDWQPV